MAIIATARGWLGHRLDSTIAKVFPNPTDPAIGTLNRARKNLRVNPRLHGPRIPTPLGRVRGGGGRLCPGPRAVLRPRAAPAGHSRCSRPPIPDFPGAAQGGRGSACARRPRCPRGGGGAGAAVRREGGGSAEHKLRRGSGTVGLRPPPPHTHPVAGRGKPAAHPPLPGPGGARSFPGLGGRGRCARGGRRAAGSWGLEPPLEEGKSGVVPQRGWMRSLKGGSCGGSCGLAMAGPRR